VTSDAKGHRSGGTWDIDGIAKPWQYGSVHKAGFVTAQKRRFRYMTYDVEKLTRALEHALCQTKLNGGYSLWFDGTEREQGYVVGNGKLGLKWDSLRPLEPADLIKTAQHFASNVKADGIGFWSDKGILYIDPIFHFQNLYEARIAGYQYGELAIYDLGNQATIWLQQRDNDK